MKKRVFFFLPLCLLIHVSWAQNPFITDQYTADPTARVIGDKVYVFPSHDIRCAEGVGRGPNWFCMEDYHVFSSENLVDWTDHGMIVDQKNVPWANQEAYSMWAPDCIEKDGKFYFYYPTIIGDTTKYWRGFGIGVATSDQPEGPYKIEPEPIQDVRGIDPNVFIDQDGQAYLYWSARKIFVAKLEENMMQLATKVDTIDNLPTKGLIEGPFMFERNGKYYLTYPHVENKTERIEYAMGDSPMGPFTVTGVIMDESPTGCWTNHHSIIEFKDQWYFFYHHNDYSPTFDKSRSIRVDSLSFNDDGTIRKIEPTLRGVGLTDAFGKIELDRYSALSETGASIDLLDSADTFKGWKTILSTKDSWIQYNSVEFAKEARSIEILVKSSAGGKLQILSGDGNGDIIAEIKIPKGESWQTVKAKLKSKPLGTQNLIVKQKGDSPVEIDWVGFE